MRSPSNKDRSENPKRLATTDSKRQAEANGDAEVRKKFHWQFNAQCAVDLIFGVHAPKFEHQLVVYSYLLICWAIWPDKKNIVRRAALSVAFRICFLKTMDKATRLGRTPVNSVKGLADRVNRQWFKNFVSEFVDPLGGLGKIMRPPPSTGLDSWRIERLSSLRAELELVGVLEKCHLRGRPELTRPLATALVRVDYSRKGTEYYGLKRRTTPKQTDRLRGESTIMGPSRGDEMWSHSPSTTVLLYCMNDVIGEKILRILDGDSSFGALEDGGSIHLAMRAALSRYENLMRRLETLPRLARHVTRWRVVTINSPQATDMLICTKEEEQVFEDIMGKLRSSRGGGQ